MKNRDLVFSYAYLVQKNELQNAVEYVATGLEFILFICSEKYFFFSRRDNI